jgi:serine/threonine protein kinase
MAEVLLAARTGASGFEKLVVLKRILSHLKEDGQFLQMFLNEARLAALLKHPNIVEIYDVERSEGDFVVVMEYLSGEDLRYLIGHLRQERHPMDIGVACRIISDAAAALHFAHTATDMDGKPMSVVHRDVAPGNILVTYDGVTKLLDFGIAKATTRATYTVPGTMKGKFAYMSPEHIQQMPLDGRSDIFSLGVVFWELLAAQRLFKGTNDAAVLKQVMEREIPPPSAFNPDLPPALDQIVLSCVERDHNKRPASARQVREQLEELLVQTGRYVTTSQVAEWMRDTLPWRYHQRREMERTVVREARNGAPSGMHAALPQGNAPSAAIGRGMTGSVPLFPGSRTATGSSGGHSAPSAPAVVQHPGSISTLSAQQPSMPSYAGYAPPPAQRSALLIVAISATITLLLVGLAVGFYLLGRHLNAKPAYLVVHAVPEGSRLKVNGQPSADGVGAAGVKVAVRPSTRVHLKVSKTGRIPQEATLVAPKVGTRHVYFTLPRARP